MHNLIQLLWIFMVNLSFCQNGEFTTLFNLLCSIFVRVWRKQIHTLMIDRAYQVQVSTFYEFRQISPTHFCYYHLPHHPTIKHGRVTMIAPFFHCDINCHCANPKQILSFPYEINSRHFKHWNASLLKSQLTTSIYSHYDSIAFLNTNRR